VASLALIWSGVVLWRERQRRRRSRELVLVVRTAATYPPATVDDEPAALGPAELEVAALEVADSEPDEVAVEAVDAVDELLALLARAETPRPPVTLRLRWRDTALAADSDTAVPVVRQVRRNPRPAPAPPPRFM
jgi:hypothetical protein